MDVLGCVTSFLEFPNKRQLNRWFLDIFKFASFFPILHIFTLFHIFSHICVHFYFKRDWLFIMCVRFKYRKTKLLEIWRVNYDTIFKFTASEIYTECPYFYFLLYFEGGGGGGLSAVEDRPPFHSSVFEFQIFRNVSSSVAYGTVLHVLWFKSESWDPLYPSLTSSKLDMAQDQIKCKIREKCTMIHLALN